ncbi:hypothetical protein KSP39_PZI007814 [Platanthera zijinensis]|uniref:Uncharacterized protein n=1 Tax=Platanthera zijinensis TaxID=2320716 RepID=A0AAP0BMM4_9ASPA
MISFHETLTHGISSPSPSPIYREPRLPTLSSSISHERWLPTHSSPISREQRLPFSFARALTMVSFLCIHIDFTNTDSSSRVRPSSKMPVHDRFFSVFTFLTSKVGFAMFSFDFPFLSLQGNLALGQTSSFLTAFSVDQSDTHDVSNDKLKADDCCILLIRLFWIVSKVSEPFHPLACATHSRGLHPRPHLLQRRSSSVLLPRPHLLERCSSSVLRLHLQPAASPSTTVKSHFRASLTVRHRSLPPRCRAFPLPSRGLTWPSSKPLQLHSFSSIPFPSQSCFVCIL